MKGAPSRLLRTLADALDAPGGPHANAHVLVAVSGGPDSTALLVALAELGAPRGLTLTAAHVDHGLRGAAGAQEGERVRALAAEIGVGFVGRTLGLAAGPDLEARARHARYRALAALAKEVGAAWIATGHTRDDQVETVLLRLLRGAGRGALGGMRRIRGRLLRPLLGATRADVRRFLAERGLDFAVDPTNADLGRTRNRVRRLLVPFLEAEFNPRLGPALAALAERLRDEDEFLAATAAARGAAHVTGDTLAVSVAGEAPALARRIVRAWMEQGAPRGVSAEHVERVLALAAGRARGTVAVPGPARVLREGDRLVRRPGRHAVAPAFDLPIVPGGSVGHPVGAWRLALSAPRPRRRGESRAADPSHALFDAEALPPVLTVRGPRPGDRIRLPGGGTRKLQDVLVDAKVPREARPAVPLLAAGDDILWVAGVLRGRGAGLGPDSTRVVEGVLVRSD